MKENPAYVQWKFSHLTSEHRFLQLQERYNGNATAVFAAIAETGKLCETFHAGNDQKSPQVFGSSFGLKMPFEENICGRSKSRGQGAKVSAMVPDCR